MLIDAHPPPRPRPASVTWLGDIYPEDAQSVQPLRFRLAELFVVITVAAALLALFRAVGIFGALFSFITALAFTNELYPRWRSKQDQEAMFDFIWGIIMPIVCLVFDPFVFKFDQDVFDMANGHEFGFSLSRAHFSAFSIPVYTFIVAQWLSLALLIIIGRPSPRLAAFLSGFLAVGFLFSGVLGVLLFVPSLLGVFAMAIGVLGLTPLFTARAYYRRTKYASAIAGLAPSHSFIRAVGVSVALLLPAFVFLVTRFVNSLLPLE